MCVYSGPRERGSEREGGRGMIEREETIERQEARARKKKGREGDE